MAAYKNRWYHKIYFEFYLNIPLLLVETQILTQAIGRDAYQICRVKIKVWKWTMSFDLYKRPSRGY